MILVKRWSIIRCRMLTLLLPTVYNLSTDNKIFIKSILVFDIYILKPKSWLIDWLIEASRRPFQNSYVCKLWYTERKKLSHFDIKSWLTCGTKIRPGKVGSWRIFESTWLKIKSQIWINIERLIDWTLRVKLAQHWESSWFNIESQIDSTLRVKLTQHWKSNWLNIESQIDSTLRVKLTQQWESNWLNYSQVTHFTRSNYNSASDSTFKFKFYFR